MIFGKKIMQGNQDILCQPAREFLPMIEEVGFLLSSEMCICIQYMVKLKTSPVLKMY